MQDGNSAFKDLEPTDEVPAYLKNALISEVDTIRDTMQIVEHFTDNFLNAILVSLSISMDD